MNVQDIIIVAVMAFALLFVAILSSRTNEIIIGHEDMPRPDPATLPDPRKCQHKWDDGIAISAQAPNRWKGSVCEKCGAIRWENGDITIDRG